VYVVDYGENIVRKVTPVGTNWVVKTIAGTAGATGTAGGANAEFNNPFGLARDGGNNLYVADSGNNAVRKLALVGGNWLASPIAGTPGAGNNGSKDGINGSAQFNFPCGIAVDAAGTLYVADTGNNIIRQVALVGGNWVTTTIAGTADLFGGELDGTNGVAEFTEPSSIAVDAVGRLFVTDEISPATGEGSTIRMLTPLGGGNWAVTTIAGADGYADTADGTNTDAHFSSPAGIAVDAGDNLYVADSGNGLIRKVSPVGTNWVTTTLAGSANAPPESDGTGTNAVFGLPAGIAVDGSGRLFVGDIGDNDLWQGALALVPNLTIGPVATNSVVISWVGSSGFVLQTNGSLTAPNWGNYGGVLGSNNGTNSVTLAPPVGTLFFRLAN